MGQSGPWGSCRLLVVNSLPRTAIKHRIINFWTKKKKIKPNGCYWSRLVAKGFFQVEGIDFDELFSPVVCYETARLLLAVAALEDLDIEVLTSKQPTYMVIWMKKSTWSSQKVSNYLGKKTKSSDFAKHCMVLSKLAYPGGTQWLSQCLP